MHYLVFRGKYFLNLVLTVCGRSSLGDWGFADWAEDKDDIALDIV